MQTSHDHTVAAGFSVDPGRWRQTFEELMGRVAGRFARIEPRRHARAFVAGLVAELPDKNCWSIAEHAGQATPDGMQHLLARASWDVEGVRDDLREFVADHLGRPDGVLVADETGDVKKGHTTVGVQRQYTGTAGRIENSQVAVYLAYASTCGHALIDRRLYLPRAWTNDAHRCAAAGVPQQVEFATKPTLARQMLTDALEAGVPAAWVTADEVYGGDPRLRAELETRSLGYVLAVACSHRVTTPAGTHRVDALAAHLPRRSWQRYSAGAGAKGQRYYHWAWVGLTSGQDAGQRHLLIRRNRHTGELAYYRCYSPHPVPLATLVRVAGTRWTIEESFQTSKGLTGLDEHQVRRWRSWHRWTTLAMAAHALLAILAATERAQPSPPAHQTALTCNEIQRLITALLAPPPHSLQHHLRWSTWRRHHQHRARRCHYQHQATQQP